MISSKRSLLSDLLIIGYTTRRHLLLDLDDTTLEKARRLSYMIMKQWPNVGDCLIIRSSAKKQSLRVKYNRYNDVYVKMERENYHLVFDNIIGYNTCCKICVVLAWLDILNRDYIRIRTFRGDMTLRVSPAVLTTGVKPAPEPVEYLFNTAQKWRDRKIDDYLAFRSAALGLSPAAQMVAKVRAHGGAAKGLQN